MIDMALMLYQEPEVYAAWEAVTEGWDLEDVGEESGALADLLLVPASGRLGKPLTDAERDVMAVYVINLALQTTDRWDGRFDTEYGRLPVHVARHVLIDAMMQGEGDLHLVNVDKETAARFIRRHHRHLPFLNTRGLMYALGAMIDGHLVAVATAGTPTGRWAKPHNVLELTRIASDGSTKNAASLLAARLVDLLPQAGRAPDDPSQPSLFVTYSFLDEAGTTYKALRGKGLRPVAFVPPRAPGGSRSKSSRGGSIGKIRWEAGPNAAPANWDLLLPAVRQRLAEIP